jgi:DNA-binding MarR family transcriptional regulator
VAFTTIHKFEQGGAARQGTVAKLLEAFAANGVSVLTGAAGEGAVLNAAPYPTAKEAAEAIAEGIVRISRAARLSDRRARLGGTQLAVLASIRYNPGISVKVLAKLEGVTHPAMSRMITALTAAGLVSGHRAGDARFQRLILTQAGLEVFNQAWERRVALAALLVQRLHPSSAADFARAVGPLADQSGMAAERFRGEVPATDSEHPA